MSTLHMMQRPFIGFWMSKFALLFWYRNNTLYFDKSNCSWCIVTLVHKHKQYIVFWYSNFTYRVGIATTRCVLIHQCSMAFWTFGTETIHCTLTKQLVGTETIHWIFIHRRNIMFWYRYNTLQFDTPNIPYVLIQRQYIAFSYSNPTWHAA